MKNKVRFVMVFLAVSLFACNDVLKSNVSGNGLEQDEDVLKSVNDDEEDSLSLEGIPVYWRDSTELWKEEGDVYLAFWPKDADGVPRSREVYGGISYETYDQKIGERSQGYLSITLPEEIPDSCLVDPKYILFSWEETWEGPPGLLMERARFAGLKERTNRRQLITTVADILYASMDGRIESKSGVYVDLKRGWNFLAYNLETGEYTRFGSLKELYSHAPFELQTYYSMYDDNPPQ